MNNEYSRAIPDEHLDSYRSEHIRNRLARKLDNQPLEEVIGPKYMADVLECLDILDIGYPVTAIGILGRALEGCTKEYCQKKIKSKKMFSINTGDFSIKTIRKKFWIKGNHDNRLKLLNQQEITVASNPFKLNKKLLKDDYYGYLISIKNARNKAFHGCTEEDYKDLEALSLNYIEYGLIILITFIKAINEK
ncbi:MAG: hypothetical protein KAX49_13490 [Halanaerobiales bacterium]|nr:hypothetical protein [Halanaerobiales bacterium]